MTAVPYFPFSLPANSVMGRMSPNTGDAESIPFGALAIALALNATSTTSLTIGTGSKTLTTQTGLPISVGQLVIVADTPSPTNYMFGQVTAYSATTGSLTVNVTAIGGSGTIATWTISATGPAGATGAAGAFGSIPVGAGGGAVDAITVTISGPTTVDQTIIAVVSAGANVTATPTLKLNSDTAHTITARGGGALIAGDTGVAGFVGLYEYNSAGTRWELMNPAVGAVPATKAQQQTASSNVVFITPAHQQDHPGSAKFWGKCGIAGDLSVSYNITSISDRGPGQVDIVIGTDFSTGNYDIGVTLLDNDSVNHIGYVSGTLGQAAGTFSIDCVIGGTGVLQDPVNGYFFHGHGTQ